MVHRWSRNTVQRSTFLWSLNAVHCTAMYIPIVAERCTRFSCTLMVHRGTQYTVLRSTFLWPRSAVQGFVYIDDTPENAVHCSAKYIPITAEQCTVFSCTSKIHRRALYTYSDVHSYDRGALYRGFRVHWWYTAERCTLFCDVHSYDHGALYSVFLYIDDTPQIAVQCSAKYIPMIAEQCTGFPCTSMIHRRTQYTVLRCTFLWPRSTVHCTAKYIPMTAERCTCTAKYIPMTAERCTLYSEVHSYN